MKFTEFLRRQMSENGEPSNNRVMLFLFLTTVVCMVLAVTVAPLFKPTVPLVLPVIPPSFESMVEYITVFLVGGGVLGKGINAYQNKGVASTTTTTATSTEVKGAPDGILGSGGTEGK
jgi:hypothetical protein